MAEALAELSDGRRPLVLHGLLLLRDGCLGALELCLRVGTDVLGEVHSARGRLLDLHLEGHRLLLKLLDVLREGLELVAESVDHTVVPEHDFVGQPCRCAR